MLYMIGVIIGFNHKPPFPGADAREDGQRGAANGQPVFTVFCGVRFGGT